MVRIFSVLSAVSIAFSTGAEEPKLPSHETVLQVPQVQAAALSVEDSSRYAVSLTDRKLTLDEPLVLDRIPQDDEILITEAQIAAKREQERLIAEALEAQRQAEEAARLAEEQRLAEEAARLAREQEEQANRAAVQAQASISGEVNLDAATFLGNYKLTAYCPCEICCGKTPSDPGYGITASGAVATEGVTVAMDSSIPFGTRIYIEGVGVRIVQDRGGAIGNGRIDIYCSTHERCYSDPAYVQNAAKVWILN